MSVFLHAGRYQAWGVRPEGGYLVSEQNDLATAFADAASAGTSEVYDNSSGRWVDPESTAASTQKEG